MKAKEINDLIKYWMPIIRVDDWEYRGLEWDEDFFKDKKDIMCAVNFNYYTHVFTINMRRKASKAANHKVEFILIHELLHLLLYPIDYIASTYEEHLEIDPDNCVSDSIIDDIRYKDTEIVINKIASALHKAYGKYKQRKITPDVDLA